MLGPAPLWPCTLTRPCTLVAVHPHQALHPCGRAPSPGAARLVLGPARGPEGPHGSMRVGLPRASIRAPLAASATSSAVAAAPWRAGTLFAPCPGTESCSGRSLLEMLQRMHVPPCRCRPATLHAVQPEPDGLQRLVLRRLPVHRARSF